MRFPVFYYRLKYKLLAFIDRNFTGCAYCNEKKVWKMFGEKGVPLDNFNTLIDSVPVEDGKTRYACYFYPKQRCIEVNRVDENGKYITVESIFVHNCPECGRPLPYILDSEKKKKKKEKVVVASTPKGQNMFYDMWNKSTGKKEDTNNKILAELEESLKALPDEDFHALMDRMEKVAETR